MNGYEIDEKYGITTTCHSLFLECSEMCQCGHHAKYHKGKGSAGWCNKCDKNKKMYGGAYAHNFIPVDSRSHEWGKYCETKEAIDNSFLDKRDLIRLSKTMQVRHRIELKKKQSWFMRLISKLL